MLSLCSLLSSDCGQFTTCPGRCVVLKNTGCALFSRARLLSRIASRLVSRISSDHRSSWLACSLLSALGTAPLATDRLAARLRSRITALLGTRLCLACVTLLGSDVAAGLCSLLSPFCSLAAARLMAPPHARRFLGLRLCSASVALLGSNWLGSTGSDRGFDRLPAQPGSAWLDWLGSRL